MKKDKEHSLCLRFFFFVVCEYSYAWHWAHKSGDNQNNEKHSYTGGSLFCVESPTPQESVMSNLILQ